VKVNFYIVNLGVAVFECRGGGTTMEHPPDKEIPGITHGPECQPCAGNNTLPDKAQAKALLPLFESALAELKKIS
jgi:hypothetical protein